MQELCRMSIKNKSQYLPCKRLTKTDKTRSIKYTTETQTDGHKTNSARSASLVRRWRGNKAHSPSLPTRWHDNAFPSASLPTRLRDKYLLPRLHRVFNPTPASSTIWCLSVGAWLVANMHVYSAGASSPYTYRKKWLHFLVVKKSETEKWHTCISLH